MIQYPQPGVRFLQYQKRQRQKYDTPDIIVTKVVAYQKSLVEFAIPAASGASGEAASTVLRNRNISHPRVAVIHNPQQEMALNFRRDWRRLLFTSNRRLRLAMHAKAKRISIGITNVRFAITPNLIGWRNHEDHTARNQFLVKLVHIFHP